MCIFTTKIFGLDISDSSIEALEIKKSFSHYQIKSYSRIKLESGLVSDGIILDSEKLAAKIRNLLEQAKPQKTSTKNVALCLPESRIYSSLIRLPITIKEKELAEAVNNQIPEVLPIEEGTVVTSWQKIGSNSQEQEILIAAIDNNILKSYIMLAKNLGLKIVSLEMESLATGRAIIEEVKNNEGVLLLDIGARTSNITVFDNHGLYSTYSIKIAGQNFTEAISKAKNISLIEAEKFKVKQEKVADLPELKPFINELIAEIKKTIDHFEEKSGKNITQGYIVGGSALLDGLLEYLSSALGIKLQLGNPFTKIENHDIISNEKEKVLFATVMGLAKKAADKDDKIINFIK
jgi:type IV pilus assembly protein PilM